MKFKKASAVILAISIISASILPAYADEVVDNIRYQQSIVAEQQAQAIANRDAIRTSITALEAQKNELLAQADEYDQQIITTIATIQTIDKQIENKTKELEQTEKDLKKAVAEKKSQYDAMKKRIQYMYEEGGELGLASVMLEDASISDVVDRVSNTQDMYDYDREALDAYTIAEAKVAKLQKTQRAQHSELTEMKKEQEGIKTNLEDLKATAMAASEDFQAQIVYCEGVAAQYQELIDEQYAQICQLQAMEAEAVAAEQARIAAAEEAARRAEAEQAAMQAMAAQQAAQAQAAAQAQYYDNSAETYTEPAGDVYSEPVYEDTSYADAGYYEEPSYDYSEPVYEAPAYEEPVYEEPVYEEPSYDYTEPTSTASGNSLGSEIANYATQFVGNPYVWGGTSLTDGADCSGFVQSVFGNYGINLSRTTYTQANEGTPVSYSDMQPGDVINYGYHTAIYLGDNQIVHAADEDHGIIIQDNPAYQPIVTIRRFT